MAIALNYGPLVLFAAILIYFMLRSKPWEAVSRTGGTERVVLILAVVCGALALVSEFTLGSRTLSQVLLGGFWVLLVAKVALTWRRQSRARRSD